jgi:hypothetical protein
VIITLPDGNEYDIGDEVKVIFTVRDPDGVRSFTYGFFTQNQSPLGGGGTQECGGNTECSREIEEEVPPLEGTFIVGADAVDSKGETNRGIGEIYVSK